jgi:hypothetical protein
LGQGWQVSIVFGDGAVAMSARNKVRYLKYVTGQRQVPGHANTGWPLHQLTLDFWAQTAREETVRALGALVNNRR